MLGVKKRVSRKLRSIDADGNRVRVMSPERLNAMRQKLGNRRQGMFQRIIDQRRTELTDKKHPKEYIESQVKYLEGELRKRGYTGPEVANKPKALQPLRPTQLKSPISAPVTAQQPTDPSTDQGLLNVPLRRNLQSDPVKAPLSTGARQAAAQVTGAPSAQRPQGLSGTLSHLNKNKKPYGM